MRYELEDVKIRQRLAGCVSNFFHQSDAPFRVDKRSLLFAPPGGRQDEVRLLRRVRARIHILHDEELQFAKHACQFSP